MAASKRQPRVFIGLREVSGYYGNLKKGFDQLGCEAAFISLSHTRNRYSLESNPKWAVVINSISQWLSRHLTGTWAARILVVGVLQNIMGPIAFLFALFRYDVFIFGSVSTFFFFLDQPILKLFGKKIIHVFVGSDSRPIYLNGYVMERLDRKSIFKGVLLTFIQKTVLKTIDKFADVIVNIPPQAYFHTRTVANGYIVGYPFEWTGPVIPYSKRVNEKPHILHAPSKPGPKGSVQIKEMMIRLKNKGYDFNYTEITGKTHAEVIAEIQNCDFVVDELYSDMPMSLFAAEAAFFGKPAVVGGYYSAHVKEFLNSEEIPPSFFCLPEAVESAIEKMLIDKELREKIGNAAQVFVKTRWAPKAVAERYLQLLEKDTPTRWWFDPKNIKYRQGCGLSEEGAKKTIRSFVEAGGKRALCLQDKPELRDDLITWALE